MYLYYIYIYIYIYTVYPCPWQGQGNRLFLNIFENRLIFNAELVLADN